MDFSVRSSQKELLDERDIPSADLYLNLKELAVINRFLGGHKTTIAGLKKIINDRQKTWKIIDLGCGGGDTLRAIADWATAQKISVELTGVDMKAEAIEYAQAQSREYSITYILADFKTLSKGTYDIATSALFCHHLSDQENQTMLSIKLDLATYALINDLHRHPLAYYSIKLLTSLFSKSYLVKNDAPLSVARAFKRTDFKRMFGQNPSSH